MSEWIKHDGRRRPVERDVVVIVKMRDGYENAPVRAGFWGDGSHDESNWWHDPSQPMLADITEYKIVDPHAPSSPSGP